MRRSLGVHLVWMTLLMVTAAAQTAGVQVDALALQKRAVARIDAVVDRFRRTGDTRLQISELMQADAELTVSNRALAGRQDWSALAFGLTKQGHVYRLQAQWQQAIALYKTAEAAASRGRDVVKQSDALAWEALAESSSGNLGNALTNATQAVRLAETTTDSDTRARALDVLGSVQIAQLNLTAASDTINREVAVAMQATDPTALYYAYQNRSDVYLKLAGQCDYNRSFDACNQALDRAQADLQQAAGIVQRLGYGGLLQQTQQFMRDVTARRALVQSQQASVAAVARTGVFQPKTARDVLVTDKFVTSPGQIPPALAAAVRSAKQMETQLGGFADVVQARTQYTDGVLAEMQGNNEAALGFYMKAIDTLDRDRRSLHDDASRGTFAEDRINFYYAAVLQLLERRRFSEAFEVLERSRSRALADLIASRTLGLGRPSEQALYAEATLLRTQIADAQGRLFELASQPDAAKNPARLSTINTQIRTLEAQYQQVSSRMAAEAPRLQSLVDSKPASSSSPASHDAQRTVRDGAVSRARGGRDRVAHRARLRHELITCSCRARRS